MNKICLLFLSLLLLHASSQQYNCPSDTTCDKCAVITNNCEQCVSGYQLNTLGQCSNVTTNNNTTNNTNSTTIVRLNNCSDENCAFCVANGTCRTCKFGFFLDSNETNCINNTNNANNTNNTNNTSNTNNTNSTITTVGGSPVNATLSCGENCVDCGADGICETCNTGWLFDGTDCSINVADIPYTGRCPGNCLTCANAVHCTVCNIGYALNDNRECIGGFGNITVFQGSTKLIISFLPVALSIIYAIF